MPGRRPRGPRSGTTAVRREVGQDLCPGERLPAEEHAPPRDSQRRVMPGSTPEHHDRRGAQHQRQLGGQAPLGQSASRRAPGRMYM